MSFPPELLLKAQGTRVAFFDIRGLLSGGACYLCGTGETSVRFDSPDCFGLQLLQKAGISPVVISSHENFLPPGAVEALAERGIGNVLHPVENIEDKWQAIEKTLQALNTAWTQVAVMGSDWPDLALMRCAAFTGAPADAHAEVKSVADYVGQAACGHGAAREFCDLLLIASGRYAGLLREYTA
jgi:3-deoxy-D-manno-octulosonate 8-phosphate phosphatase (KDO 8-P phosphatase)